MNLTSSRPSRLSPLLLGLCAFAAQAAAEPASPGVQAPAGFELIVFHDGVGQRARHLAVRDNGDVFVTRRDGVLLALRDTDGDGQADMTRERKVPVTNGLALHEGYVYFSDDVSVSRIALGNGLMPEGDVETVVSGFPEQASHATKAIAINAEGGLFVNVGAPSNACQTQRRTPGSPGVDPCPQLERQAAIWRFDAAELGQDQTDGERYVTGTRNIVALDWHPPSRGLYFAMHGRDQLGTLWPGLYDDADNAELPAEEFHRAEPGADYGWPSTFYDPAAGRRLIAPEYGGDGETEPPEGRYREPLHAYPAHWAPNDLVFYPARDEGGFPEAYHDGAFIAWRGSWNRAPLPQDGYRVTFQPMAEGAPTGDPEDFLVGFKGTDELLRPSAAAYRPGGLAVGPDGALYVTETVQGRIWKVVWTGQD